MDVGPQLAALADPTRRRIFELVNALPRSVREITELIPVSQPAVSQHLRVLLEADLVTKTPVGTRRVYEASGGGLAALRSWLDSMWEDVVDAFLDAAESADQSNEDQPE